MTGQAQPQLSRTTSSVRSGMGGTAIPSPLQSPSSTSTASRAASVIGWRAVVSEGCTMHASRMTLVRNS